MYKDQIPPSPHRRLTLLIGSEVSLGQRVLSLSGPPNVRFAVFLRVGWQDSRKKGPRLRSPSILHSGNPTCKLGRLPSIDPAPCPPFFKASVILQRCPRLAEAAKAGELLAGLSSSANTRAGGESEFLLVNLENEVVAELDTPWDVSVKKWRCACI